MIQSEITFIEHITALVLQPCLLLEHEDNVLGFSLDERTEMANNQKIRRKMMNGLTIYVLGWGLPSKELLGRSSPLLALLWP